MPRLYDRLLLGGAIVGAAGIVLSRTGGWEIVGTVLAVSGVAAVMAGLVLKIRRGR